MGKLKIKSKEQWKSKEKERKKKEIMDGLYFGHYGFMANLNWLSFGHG